MSISALNIFSCVRRYVDIEYDFAVFPTVFRPVARHNFLLFDASLSNRKGRTGTAALYLLGQGRRCGEPPLIGAAARPCRLRDASGLSEHG
jgi:hypothetical protein